MAFQQARPYDTGPGALATMYDIQRLVSGDRQNTLGDMQLAQAQQKQMRGDTAHDAQQKLLGSITDPQQRLAALYAPEKWAASILRDPKDHIAATERGIWNYADPNNPKFTPTPNFGGYSTLGGQRVGGGPGGQAPAPAPAAGGPGGNLDLPGFRTARRRFEGGTSGSAPPNPNSSAQGPDQFIESTWERLMLSKGRPFIDLKIGPNADVNDPKVKAAIQELRNDDDVSGAMAEEYARENAAELQSAGIQPTNRNLVVAHFLGGSGAKRFLSADPNAPAASHVDPAALNANRSVFFDKATGRARTVAEVLAEVDRRTGEVTGQQSASGASPTPGQGYPQASGGASGGNNTGVSGEQLEALIDNHTGKFDTHFGLNPRTGRPERYQTKATTEVNIGEKAGAKEIVEGRVKRYETIAQQGQVSQELLGKLDLLQERLKDVGVQGPGADNFYSVIGTLESLGVPRDKLNGLLQQVAGIDIGDPAAASNVQKLTHDFVSQALKGLGSSPTDMDAEMVMKTVPGINNLADANTWLMNNVLRPQLQSKIGLWQKAIQLANDPNNPTLNGIDQLAFEHGNQRKPLPPRTTHRSGEARSEDKQAASTDTVPNPTVDQPPTEQEIKAAHPNAVFAPSINAWVVRDPNSPSGWSQVGRQ